jgi:hypothetical protein
MFFGASYLRGNHFNNRKTKPMNINPIPHQPYTKGEWYLQEFTDAYTNIIRCNNGKHETLFIASTPQSDRPEARANAKLMAAAPDLLEALQGIISITDRDHIALVKAKAAIEKAVGDIAKVKPTQLEADPNTQLPAETLAEIELKAEHEAALHFHPEHSRDQNTACRICYRNGAKEYATNLHQVEKERDELRHWKMEAVELQIPIIAYVHKHLECNVGDSCTALVVAELDRLRDENARLKIALENVYRIHGHQWSEYDRNVIKDLIK